MTEEDDEGEEEEEEENLTPSEIKQTIRENFIEIV